jgi:hypothetical protein
MKAWMELFLCSVTLHVESEWRNFFKMTRHMYIDYQDFVIVEYPGIQVLVGKKRVGPKSYGIPAS